MQPRAMRTWLKWIGIAGFCGALLGMASEATAACSGTWTSGATTLFNACGLVGVGTSSLPIYNFHVRSTSSFAEAAIQGGTSADTGLLLIDPSQTWKIGINVFAAGSGKFSIFDSTHAANRLTIDTNGNVGIGTTAPNVNLDVTGKIALSNSGNSSTAGAQFRTYLSNDSNWGLSNTAGSGAGSNEYHLRVHGWGGGTGNLRQFQVIDSSAANQVRFAVSFATGDVTVTGNIAAKYQDLAEWVRSPRPLEAGTVVVLDPERSNEVVASARPYDTRVAGVISEKPGVILGERGEGKVMVSTTGRVRVKVDAGRGPVRVGDLLVTSDREGFAMKSEPLELGGVTIHRPGTLIGKALEPLPSGPGEILVLLSLQ